MLFLKPFKDEYGLLKGFNISQTFENKGNIFKENISKEDIKEIEEILKDAIVGSSIGPLLESLGAKSNKGKYEEMLKRFNSLKTKQKDKVLILVQNESQIRSFIKENVDEINALNIGLKATPTPSFRNRFTIESGNFERTFHVFATNHCLLDGFIAGDVIIIQKYFDVNTKNGEKQLLTALDIKHRLLRYKGEE